MLRCYGPHTDSFVRVIEFTYERRYFGREGHLHAGRFRFLGTDRFFSLDELSNSL